MVWLSLLRVLLVIVMLGYAAYQDLKTREVHDLLWITFGLAGLLINTYELITKTMSLTQLALPLAFSMGFAAVFWFVGLMGEADLLALVTVTLLHPQPLLVSFFPVGSPPLLFPLTILSNSVLLGASSSLIILVTNLLDGDSRPLFEGFEREPTWRKIAVLLTSRKIGIDEVRGPPFHYPREAINEASDRVFNLGVTIVEDEEALEAFEGLRAAGLKRVWVSLTLPFLAFLTLSGLTSTRSLTLFIFFLCFFLVLL